MSTAEVPTRPRGATQPNLWWNLIFNAILPALLLSYGSRPRWLGPVWGLVTALIFPIGYGIWDLVRSRSVNLISILGFTSVLLTGGLGLMKLGGIWFAIKEATLPAILALALPWSLRTRQPLVRTLLYNDQVLNTTRIDTALAERGNATGLDRLLGKASWMLAGAMLVGGITNFALAWWLLPAHGGTPEFNRQLGKLQFWSWPGTMLPTGAMTFYALFRLLHGLEDLTGLSSDDLFHAQSKPAAAAAAVPVAAENPDAED